MRLLSSLSLVLASAPAWSGVLSGTVLDPDGTPHVGVSVVLASNRDSTVTGADGKWQLATQFVSIRTGRERAARPITGHLVQEGGRLHVSLRGFDAAGHPLAGFGTAASQPVPSLSRSASSIDTLLYKSGSHLLWKDTITQLDRQGMTRTFDTTLNTAIIHGYVKDGRDGKTYRTVKIGSKVWTAQNIAYKADSSFCYGDDSTNCFKYGRLYKWHAGMGLSRSYDATQWDGDTTSQQGACPAGFHVPTYTEWIAMLSVPTTKRAGTLLKATAFWNTAPGTDSLGFHALPAGYWIPSSKAYAQIGNWTVFMTSTQLSETSLSEFSFNSFLTSSYESDDKANRFSLRCVQN